MKYGSVCSGIEAATAAWHGLGWQPAFFSEIDAFPRAVLAYHYPGVPLHGDFTTIQPGDYEPIDLLVGGTPCQSFSIAGLRGGLGDDRGNLALEYLRLADRLRPRWLVWENVPGVLSSNGGRDFGSILGGMVKLGYGIAYRVLDAQFFGVPQRRRRVFVVGYLGDWRRAAAVLFERESLSGHPAPSRKAGQGVARPIARGSDGSSGYRNDADTAENLIAFGGNNTAGPIDTATAVNACASASGRLDFESETFVTHSLRARATLDSNNGSRRHNGVAAASAVRRLTPRECERLQGVADDFTLIPYGRPSKAKLDADFLKYLLRGNPKHLSRDDVDRLAKDGPRYKALGNSMAAPCMAWLGRRIQLVDAIVAANFTHERIKARRAA